MVLITPNLLKYKTNLLKYKDHQRDLTPTLEALA